MKAQAEPTNSVSGLVEPVDCCKHQVATQVRRDGKTVLVSDPVDSIGTEIIAR